MEISDEKSFHWAYQGSPILLLGATNTDHLFQWKGNKLQKHLDELKSAGGNYVRNTMSDRADECVYAFKELEEGKFDLEKWNEEYWDRFDNFLKETSKRDIIVQIEIWDPWDFSEGNWEKSPYNPKNNVNYRDSEVDVSEDWDNDNPMFEDPPFLLAAPNLNNHPKLHRYQKKFVRKVLEHSLEYDNILYTVANESSLPQRFSNHWAEFMRDYADSKEKNILIGDMRLAATPRPTLKYPEIFDFNDISQVGVWTKEHQYEMLERIRERLVNKPSPMNVVKQYGSDEDRVDMAISEDEAVDRIWRCIMQGCASVRFHRPKYYGIGLNERAKNTISSIRKIQEDFNFFKAEPNLDVLSSRKVNEAYSLISKNDILVYFPEKGEVKVNVEEEKTVKWLSNRKSKWIKEEKITDNGQLKSPEEGKMLALIKN